MNLSGRYVPLLLGGCPGGKLNETKRSHNGKLTLIQVMGETNGMSIDLFVFVAPAIFLASHLRNLQPPIHGEL